MNLQFLNEYGELGSVESLSWAEALWVSSTGESGSGVVSM